MDRAYVIGGVLYTLVTLGAIVYVIWEGRWQ